MKALLICVIILGAWGIGESYGACTRARLAALRRFLEGLLALEGEIRFVFAPLPDAFLKAAHACPLFGAAARFAEDTDIVRAFRRAAEEDGWAKAETEILESFARGLAASDVEGQLQNIAYCRERLSSLLQALEADMGRLGRLYGSAGAMAGLLAVILLF